MLEKNAETVPSPRSFHPVERWNRQSLAGQFLLAGGLVSLMAMAVIGFLVKSQIEAGVTRNSAATHRPLCRQHHRAAAARHADQPDAGRQRRARPRRDARARRARPPADLVQAVAPRRHRPLCQRSRVDRQALRPQPEPEGGVRRQLVAEFNQIDDPESEKERKSGEPLLEIYNPVRQPWSGEVVAVSEFYEVAPDLARDLTAGRASRAGWRWPAPRCSSFWPCRRSCCAAAAPSMPRAGR